MPRAAQTCFAQDGAGCQKPASSASCGDVGLPSALQPGPAGDIDEAVIALMIVAVEFGMSPRAPRVSGTAWAAAGWPVSSRLGRGANQGSTDPARG